MQFRIQSLMITFVCLIGGGAHGQLLTNNNIQVTINSGAQLTVKGEVSNAAGTVIGNNGTIDLAGNWINNSGSSCFGTSTGTVIFNGTAQEISGSDETAFNNLILTGSGVKSLMQHVTVGGLNAVPSGILDLTTVAFDLNSFRCLVTNTNTTAITGSTGYIVSEDADNSSRVTWRINTTAGNHTIPFGNTSGVLIPFSFDLVSGNAGDVTLSTYATVPANTPLPVSPTLVTHVRNIFGSNNASYTVDRYWEIGTTGSPVASLTFTYAPAENAAAGNTDVRAQRWSLPDTSWETPLPGQFNPTSQSVFVPGVNLFGPWALAMEISPLPVELISFTADAVENNRVLCKWMTASETNNDFFTVERSKSGMYFEPVGMVDGAGNATSVLLYDFTDNNPYTGVSYYRLKQTDFDGNYSYSQIEKVYIKDGNGAGVTVFPNPSQGHFYIQFESDETVGQKINFELFDVHGKIIARSAINEMQKIKEGLFEFNGTDLLPAVYFYRVISADKLFANGKIEVLRY